MSFEVPPVNRPEPVQPAAQAERVVPAVPVPSTEAVSVDAIPSTPPAELYEEMNAASQRVDQLRAEGRELHFSYDEHEGRVQIEVRDLEGKVIRTIPPSKLLDVAGGAPLEI